MSRQSTINALVLEVNQVPNKDNKVYPKLVIFEEGQKYPSVTSISLKPEQISEVSSLVGKRANLQVEFSEFNGRVNYYYVGSAK